QLSLKNPDFTTARRIKDSINGLFGEDITRAFDSKTLKVFVPKNYQAQVVEFIAKVENLEIDPDTKARIVINERTGTVVVGQSVRISTVALAHGNISIKISEAGSAGGLGGVAQGPGGEVAASDTTEVNVSEEDARLIRLEKGVTLEDLVKGLNSIGVTPRDLITILQTIKAAGALQAELDII
ncbi:flagellar basal body P-ring protein FlgI, partial [Magnetococcales bacterium HHB-1]